MKQYQYTYLPQGAASYDNMVHKNALFILEKQLIDKPLWDKFVHVFTERPDHLDLGWRGEYFGKMMRGACLTYHYLPSDELYSILYDTVKGILDAQDTDGRITTYPKENEYCGWDMWTRKYVIVGCLYFYGICRDEIFKERIITAMRHDKKMSGDSIHVVYVPQIGEFTFEHIPFETLASRMKNILE